LRLRVPGAFVLLFVLIVMAGAATWLLPAGEYARVEKRGRLLVEAGSYHPVEARPAGLVDVFLAYPRGLEAVAPIVFYIFIIGGAFGVIQATGAVDAAIAVVVRRSGGRGPVVVAILTLFFAVGGGTIGIAEETLPFIPALVVLARRLGYDDTTGAAIALVGAGAGFAGAFMNPFTIGVAQGIAGLPLFSGLAYRLVVWAVITAIALAYVSLHASRVRHAAAAGAAPDVGAGPSARQGLVLLVLALALGSVVVGALWFRWGILEMSGLFVAVAVAAGIAGGLGGEGTAARFVEGAAAMVSGALVVGLARGVLVVLDGGRVTDTILHGLAGAVAGLPAEVAVAGIYAVQVALSYLVPSASGQAALSLPILVPLADLVGVTRQTSVLAYQFGDGFSNVFAPTSGYFMAGLALAGIPWTRWARFMWPLQALWLAAGLVLLLIAHGARYGPF